ncbi:polyketide synthase [Xylariaceae sp. FL1651]|nr:polyketide synthase [Xylariaceae sp. FL1651]
MASIPPVNIENSLLEVPATGAAGMIAIVGMGCRWPGGIRDPDGLWQMLIEKRSGYRDFGDHRFSAAGFYHPDPDRPGTTASRGGYLLTEDPRLFDQAFFGISPLEVETMDPAQRKLLEVVYEAFENAGITWEEFSDSQTGVYIGNFLADHQHIQARDADHVRPYAATGSGFSILSNRISYIFNLKGPSVTVDTACSSSMYAIHSAVSAIKSGDCGMAVVAASNCILDPSMQLMMTKLGVLSPSSACHTFDASADGYARGEGVAALVVTRVSTALSKGYPIRAIVRGTAVNANGRTGGITHPSELGQESVIRKAYANGYLPLDHTTYFECHGTGTPVGDPIEISAIGNTFSPYCTATEPLFIGSIKTNIGHTEAASAIAGLMKSIMALEKEVMPPSIGVQTLNPNMNLYGGAIKVLTNSIPWPAAKHRRVSINSFGYGGANGHCVIDHVNDVLAGYRKPGLVEADSSLAKYTTCPLRINKAGGYQKKSINGIEPSETRANHLNAPNLVKDAEATTRSLVLLPFSAHNENSLKLNIKFLREGIGKHSLADVAYTLSERRSKFTHRTFCIVKREVPAENMDFQEETSIAGPKAKGLCFVFTGQGAQWQAMGSDLFQYQVFRDSITRLDDTLKGLEKPPPHSMEDILQGNCQVDVDIPEISQSICTAVQIGLVDLLASWKVIPSVVVGHSSGEIAAAYTAGRITAMEAIVTAYCRGRAASGGQERGSMLAVGLSAEEVEEHLRVFESRVVIAGINSPKSVTISGDHDAIDIIAQIFAELNIFHRKLKTGGIAYHSNHMRSVGNFYMADLSRCLEHLNQSNTAQSYSQTPSVGWISSVTPNLDTTKLQVDGRYWCSNLESPVRFSEAVTMALSSDAFDVGAIVEIGPHPALNSPVRQMLQSLGRQVPYLPSLRRYEDGQECILRLAGKLFCLNFEIDLLSVNSVDRLKGGRPILVHGCMAIDLPPYSYDYGLIQYHESRGSKEFRARPITHHELLGSKVPGNARLRPQWRNILRLKGIPWLRDHQLTPHIIFPAAGFLSIVIEAVHRSYNENADALPIIGYSMRNVSIPRALRVPEDDYGVEIVTSMELVENATAETPSWSRFSISSTTRDSDSWVQHFTGQIKVEVTKIKVDQMLIDMDPRIVSSAIWYKRFAQIGLGYGQAFQGLSDIQADPTKNSAVGKIDMGIGVRGKESTAAAYPIHPTALDAAFQLAIIACYGGQHERAQNGHVLIRIDGLFMRSNNNAGWGKAVARGELLGLRGGHAKLQMQDQSGDIMLSISKLRFLTFAENAHIRDVEQPSAPTFRLTWKPDIRLMTREQANQRFPPPEENTKRTYLFDIFERLTTLMVVEIFHHYAHDVDLAQAPDTIQRFLSWVRSRVLDENKWTTEAQKLTSPERLSCIEQIAEDHNQFSDVRLAQHMFQNMGDILYGRQTGLDIAIQDGRLAALYESSVVMTGAYPQLYNYFNAIGHVNPTMSILEIGAGTGGATRVILRALSTEGLDYKRYKEYRFTDISSGFHSAAKKSFSRYRDLSFSILNVEEDPLQQGFKAVHDVIVASECLHATTSISRTLENCKKLLKPGGKLILVENIRAVLGHGLILGTLPGYWNGIGDGRVDSPFLSLSDWETSLQRTGFSGVDLVLEDYPAPYTMACVIVATAITRNHLIPCLDNKVTSSGPILLYDSAKPDVLFLVEEALKQSGVEFHTTQLRELHEATLPLNSRVIAFLDDGNLLIEISEERLRFLQLLVRHTFSLTVITCCGFLKGKNPNGAIAVGLFRTIGTENPGARFLSIDIHPDEVQDKRLPGAIVALELALQTIDISQASDREYVWQDGLLWVSRLVPDARLIERSKLVDTSSYGEKLAFGRHGPVHAAFKTPGILTSLYFKPYEEIWKALPDDWIQIKVAAVGLNWKDLAVASGRVDQNTISSECSGFVDRIGSAVTNVTVGDKVYGYARGGMGNYVRTPAQFVQRLRLDDDLIEVATMPLVFMTAVYAFEHVAPIRKGEKVLIQSATGGLGLAAIQLAQSMGAEVFATVGSSEKAKHLVAAVGIHEDRIFSSRKPEDMPDLLKASGGRGFDIILGTASGDLLYESIKLLAPLGRYIDVGRVDVQNWMDLGLELFQKSITFSSFDLSIVISANSELGRILMESVHKHYHAGRISPIRPLTVFDVSQLDQALLKLSKGTHIGKFVITFQNSDSLVRMAPVVSRAQLSSEAQYIIVGGFGALGKSIIRFMTERGGRYFTILSRHGPNGSGVDSFLSYLTSRGVSFQQIACDVSDQVSVTSAIERASAQQPIKGIIHAAASYEALSFDKLTAAEWNSGLAAKVLGTRNLHNASKHMPLDFFIMLTSISSFGALATQSQYTAANNFQELFARYRRSQGYTASTISYGLVTGIGSVGTNTATINTMARNKIVCHSEYEFLKLLEPVFFSDMYDGIAEVAEPWLGATEDPLSTVNIVVGLDPVRMAVEEFQSPTANRNSGEFKARWEFDARAHHIMHHFDDTKRHSTGLVSESRNRSKQLEYVDTALSNLRQKFEDAVAEGPAQRARTEALVSAAIAKAVADMLFIDASGVDSGETVVKYGVDSLIAAELRNWFKTIFRIDISMLDLLNAQTSMKMLASQVVGSALLEGTPK